MPASRLDLQTLQAAMDMLHAHEGNETNAAAAMGLPRGTFQNRIRSAKIRGVMPGGNASAPEAKAQAISRDIEVDSLRRQLREAQAGASLQEWAKAIVMQADERAKSARPAGWIGERLRTPSAAGIPTLLLSDLHWGEVVRPEEIGHVNAYDMTIANQRLRRIVDKTCSLLREDVLGDYPGIVVCLGGDMVSGSIHEELERTNDGTVMQQMLDLFEHLQTALVRLAGEFGRVHVPAVTGNHGRSQRKWHAKQRAHLSYEWLMYQFLMRAFSSDERISFDVSDGPDVDFDLLGTRYRLTHGDTFKGGDGIIGPIGPITRGTLKRGRMASAMGEPFDCLLLGHWHTLIWGGNYIVNGTLKGFDEFAMSLSITPEPPAQALWMTNEKHGRTIHLPVYAD